MATVAVILGGAIANALAFTGGQALFRALEGNSGAAQERKRHDLAVEKLNTSVAEWNLKRQKTLDYLNRELQKQMQTKSDFSDVDEALRLYNSVSSSPVSPAWGPKPVLGDFYTPSDAQLNGEKMFIIGTVALTGVIAYKYL
jgi:hypothetical protein